MKKKTFLILIALFFLATRLYKISSVPGSVYWDEASIGYNAYAIGTDLKDEWGETLPLHFRAFGEFKLPVYIYSTVPFVKIFGLNAFSVRFPAVLYTLGSLLVVYLLAKEITKKESMGLWASFIFSVSPWMFIFSRTGYEASAGVFYFLLGTYLVLFLKRPKTNFLLGTLAFIASFYSYNSFRIIIPIWLVILFLYRFSKLSDIKKNWPALALSALLFLVSLVPLYRLYKLDSGGARLAHVGVKNITTIAKNYFLNLSPKFLFLDGDANGRSQIPGHGELYFIDALFVILGLVYVIKSKKILYYIPIAMLILAPIPASITRESPHALRSILAAPSFAFLSAFGVQMFADIFKKNKKRIFVVAAFFYLLSFSIYFENFISGYMANPNDWQYEYKRIFAKQTEGVVTDQYGQPYIFALFYQKYPPAKFRSEVVYNPPNDWGFSLVSSFNGYEFKKFDNENN